MGKIVRTKEVWQEIDNLEKERIIIDREVNKFLKELNY